MQRKLFLLEILRKPEVEAFVHSHKMTRVSELALHFRGKVNFPLTPVIEWIDALQRAGKKLPVHAGHNCFFTRKSIEQASSESTALYKASQLKGKTILNICGGIGIDDWALAQVFGKVTSLDTDENLHELAQANLSRLGISNVDRQCISAEDFLLTDSNRYDWIYADPDRREAGKRLVTLADCSPNLIDLWAQIQKKSTFQLIKLSPLYPLEQLEKELPGLFRIEVVAWQDEVKEVLAFCGSKSGDMPVVRKAVSIEADGTRNFEGVPEKAPTQAPGSQGYFYEVHPALAKANLATTYAGNWGTEILIPNGIFQQSTSLIPYFFGRTFLWKGGGGYSKNKFQQYLKTLGILKANFTCRYFKQTPEELKKVHGIDDGGDDYFFFFENGNSQRLFVHGRKLAYNA